MDIRLTQHNFLRATTISLLNQILSTHLSELKITCYSFTYYSYHPNSPVKIKYDHSSEKLTKWHKHYLAENYDEIDTTLESVYQEVLPVYWHIDQQIKDAKRPREKQMRLDSKAFGSVQGISIPVHGPHDDFACFMVKQLRGENCLDNWQTLQYELFDLAYFYYHSLRRLLIKLQPQNEGYQFNAREMQCLNLIAERRNIDDIAKVMHITPRTVNYYIQRINKRLGVKSKYQAVAKVIELGLLKL
ncbi:MAG: LuxR family transcriptional regulator [Gammaproteobacteria bacterium]|nr:LuxR family transcriptional regulator [Gammaproteobacteria bacterium]